MSKQVEQILLFHNRDDLWSVRRQHNVVARVVKHTLTTMPTTSVTAMAVQSISALFAFRLSHEAFTKRCSGLRSAFAARG